MSWNKDIQQGQTFSNVCPVCNFSGEASTFQLVVILYLYADRYENPMTLRFHSTNIKQINITPLENEVTK